MEGVPSPKKPGAARAGVLVGALLLALLPGVWYARYHDQLAMTVRTFPRPGAAPTRPSGLISLPPPGPGRNRTVQIRHKGGQVVTTVNDGNLTITARATDPLPPSNPLDALGQDLCDRYNAWKCARRFKPAQLCVYGCRQGTHDDANAWRTPVHPAPGC
jgi:hypothetical protein